MKSSLLTSLRDFGLNPKDWRISLKAVGYNKPLEGTLIHREDSNLRLLGQCITRVRDNELRLCWKSLNLY